MQVAGLKVRIIKKIFYSDETGFGVYRVSAKGHHEYRTVVGSLIDVNEGDFLEISGEEVVHPRYGKQISVNSYQAVLPQDTEGIIKYLSSGRIKGIGKKSAERIVARFGHDTFKVLEESPERLREIKGIGKNVIEEIKKSSQANKTVRELTVKLSPYGIGNETIFKIYKEFGEDALLILKQNPYVLIDRVRGVGFRIADTIARSFGIAGDDRNRVRAGIVFLLSQYEQRNGDLYIEEYELVERSAALLDVDASAVMQVIGSMVERQELVAEKIPEKVIMSARSYAIEGAIARMLHSLSQSSFNIQRIRFDFHSIFKKIAVELTDEQKDAVKSAVNNRITIITGGPGTGKTTIIRAIIEGLKKAGKTVLIAAPTGRAAKRIEEASAYQASTIHRMLQIDPETGKFVHDETNPLNADAVIVDEFSMVDFFIFYSLLKAVSQHTRLVIIGDKDQLPSVGPGNVLRDVIKSDLFNIIYLSRNFRQTEDSLIIENAYRINSGENLIFRPYSEDLDFVFVKVASDTQAKDKVLNILDYYKEDYSFNAPGFQVLVPMYRGEAGIDNLNRLIQERFNPEPGFLVKTEKAAFKRGDKVMQLKNNYEKVIFNGEQGLVHEYAPEDRRLFVDFDGYVVQYAPDELEELTLSYAVSVHKSQGSEYDMVILVLLPSHTIMLNRELFYTAVTRAKRKIFLISDVLTVQRAAANASPAERKTLLPLRLQEAFETDLF